MGRFFLGFLTGLAMLALGEFCYVRFGFVDPKADVPVNRVEERFAMPSLDASVDRYAPEVRNPLDPSDANLIGGMKIYQADCANCHGDINHSRAVLAGVFYPRAPQFVQDAPDMPEYQNFYIIEHGIRLTGMPAWKRSLSDQQVWQVTTFLGQMDKLPSNVVDSWKLEANSPIPRAPF